MQQDTKNPRSLRNISIVKTFWDTGIRNTELCGLDEDDIDLSERTAVIRKKKSRSRVPFHKIYWSEETNDSIGKWIEKKHDLTEQFGWEQVSPAVFISIGGEGKYSIKMVREYKTKA